MSCIYVTDQGAKITTKDGKFLVECRDGTIRSIPQEMAESFIIFGNATMNLYTQKVCLENGISVIFLSTTGRYFGRLGSTSHYNPLRLKKQVYLSDCKEKCVDFAIKQLKAKIHNQLVVLKRYSRNAGGKIAAQINNIAMYEHRIERGHTVAEVMGYEGMAAREYFQGISKIIDEKFAFSGRNKRPPKDPFNSMISLGYTILFYEIYAEIENRSLSPYIGFIHQLKERHPALVSDLLEEWRAVLVDSTVLSLIQGHEILIEEFHKDEESGAVSLSESAMKLFLKKLETKMRSDMNYLSYLHSPVPFRKGIWWQIKNLAACIDMQDFELYAPLRIR